ncbi:MAG: viroplasmin family protein [Bacteroidales bacterium]
MSKPKSKYYVVWEGHQKGIFDSWDKCKKQVDGYTSAKYKSFESLEEAKKAFGGNPWTYFNKSTATTVSPQLKMLHGEAPKQGLCVDAACSGNPGIIEYRGVDLATGKQLFHRGPYPEGTNNIAEFLAIVSGLVYLKSINNSLPIYSDSANAIAWVKNKKTASLLKPNAINKELFELMDRAVAWLHNNTYTTKVLKWETKAWGEIPADFGRK